VLTLTAFLTAFYMTRQWLLVFFGEFRGERPVAYVNPEPGPAAPIAHDGHADHAQWRELPAMTAALVTLACFALVAGALNLPFDGGHWLSQLWGQEAPPFNAAVAVISLLVALAGIAAGWYVYRGAFAAAQDRDPLEARAPGLFRLLNEAYRFDALYAASLGRLTSILALAGAFIDQALIDGLVDGVGRLTAWISRVNYVIDDTLLNDGPDALASGANAAGRQARRLQTGKAQDYAAYVFAGALALAMLYLYVIKK
jgi:NADH-quinone oxidoreductase subunit L